MKNPWRSLIGKPRSSRIALSTLNDIPRSPRITRKTMIAIPRLAMITWRTLTWNPRLSSITWITLTGIPKSPRITQRTFRCIPGSPKIIEHKLVLQDYPGLYEDPNRSFIITQDYMKNPRITRRPWQVFQEHPGFHGDRDRYCIPRPPALEEPWLVFKDCPGSHKEPWQVFQLIFNN